MVEQSPAGDVPVHVGASAGDAAVAAAGQVRAFIDSGASCLDAETDAALAKIETQLTELAGCLRIRHVGPAVGMADMHAERVYRIVVDAHVLNVAETRWCPFVCDATDYANFRPTWPLTGVGRLRRVQVVAALPELVRGYAEAVGEHSGPIDVSALERLQALERALSH